MAHPKIPCTRTSVLWLTDMSQGYFRLEKQEAINVNGTIMIRTYGSSKRFATCPYRAVLHRTLTEARQRQHPGKRRKPFYYIPYDRERGLPTVAQGYRLGECDYTENGHVHRGQTFPSRKAAWKYLRRELTQEIDRQDMRIRSDRAKLAHVLEQLANA